MVFNPQKVKNIVTCMPMAAAPVAIIKAAIARSKSPLSSTIVTFSGFEAWRSASATAGSIWGVVVVMTSLSRIKFIEFPRFLTIVSTSFSCQYNDRVPSARASRPESWITLRTTEDSWLAGSAAGSRGAQECPRF
jgi:hypothetical protein